SLLPSADRLSRRTTLFPYTTLFRSGGIKRNGEFVDHGIKFWIAVAHPVGDSAGAKKQLPYVTRIIHIPQQVTHPCLMLERAQLRSEEHTSELQSRENLVCRLLLEKK